MPRSRIKPECDFSDVRNQILVSGGECAAYGIGSGKVFQIKNESDIDAVPDGSVLVAGDASPKYVKVMNRLSAVVTDTGSSAGHFASVAREFGVPTLVNTHNASAVLHHGQAVTVHADGRAVYDGTVTQMLESPCAKADLIVTSGGVSVGDYDLVPNVLDNLGAETVFHRLAIKPGKPLLTARLGGAWVVGLPGNPVSALVGWRLFARPLAEALAGDAQAFDEAPEIGVLTGPTRNRGERTLLAPALLEPGNPTSRVTVVPWKGSHDVLAAARANALALVESGAELAEGDAIHCYRLD